MLLLLVPLLVVGAVLLLDAYRSARIAADRAHDRLIAGSALAIADRGYVLVDGRNELEGGGRELLDDPERRATMGALGRKRVEGQLSWDHSRRHLLDAYRRLLER